MTENNNITKGNNNKSIIISNPNFYTMPIPINKFVEVITIINENIDEYHNNSITEPPDIQQKIEYNNLIGIEEIFQEYLEYIDTINEVKKVLEADKSKYHYMTNVGHAIKDKYIELNVLNKNLSEIELWFEIKNNLIQINNIKDSMLESALEKIMVYLFFQCKIFKEPTL